MGNEDIKNNNTNLCRLKDRKNLLESFLKEKYNELKNICVAEAELTGTLPIETPLGPNGTPPKFKRVIKPSNTFPEDLASQLKSHQVHLNRKGRVRGSPKKLAGGRSLWEMGPLADHSWDSTKTLYGYTEICTWPHKASPTKNPRSHPYSNFKK